MSDAITRLNAALEDGRRSVETIHGVHGLGRASSLRSRPLRRRIGGRSAASPVALLGLGVAILVAPSAAAQRVPRVVPGFGVDTVSAAWSDLAWQSSVPEIYRAWREYLLNEPGRLTPNPRWSAEEQREWRSYDLTSGVAYQRASATVVDIRPVQDDDRNHFIVKTLFSRVQGDDQDVRPIALTRVYAFQEQGEWVFGGALPRLTGDWAHYEVPPFEFFVQPGREFDRSRAERAVAFADSLSLLFDLPRLQRLSYYVADSPEEVHRIMGVDWTIGGLGYGYAVSGNNMILSGDPTFGEENRHEITHMVLVPLVSEGLTHSLISEGMATWLGGSMGRTFREVLAEYADYLTAYPDITVDTILEPGNPDKGWSPTGAILVDLVHDRGGTTSVQELLRAGRTDEDLRVALTRLLGVSWEEVVQLWRERVFAATSN